MALSHCDPDRLARQSRSANQGNYGRISIDAPYARVSALARFSLHDTDAPKDCKTLIFDKVSDQHTQDYASRLCQVGVKYEPRLVDRATISPGLGLFARHALLDTDGGQELNTAETKSWPKYYVHTVLANLKQ